MITVRTAEARPDFRLIVSFSDDTEGEVDFRPFLERKAFRVLRDPEVFSRAYVDHGAVEWPEGVGIASEALYATAHKLPRPTTFEIAKANELEMSLRELRRMTNVTQAEIAARLGMDQGQLSRFERQGDCRLSTLRRYAEALGGKINVIIEVGDKRISLRGV